MRRQVNIFACTVFHGCKLTEALSEALHSQVVLGDANVHVDAVVLQNIHIYIQPQPNARDACLLLTKDTDL